MGRLTLRNVFGRARCKKNGTKFCYETDECLYCKYNDEILEKLAHYEDLEEAGRLIELPCAVGDTVWVIENNFDGDCIAAYIAEYELTNISFDGKDFWFADWFKFGEEAFITKGEAEAKLNDLNS